MEYPKAEYRRGANLRQLDPTAEIEQRCIAQIPIGPSISVNQGQARKSHPKTQMHNGIIRFTTLRVCYIAVPP